MTWKIVGAPEALVIYIYIYIDRQIKDQNWLQAWPATTLTKKN